MFLSAGQGNVKVWGENLTGGEPANPDAVFWVSVGGQTPFTLKCIDKQASTASQVSNLLVPARASSEVNVLAAEVCVLLQDGYIVLEDYCFPLEGKVVEFRAVRCGFHSSAWRLSPEVICGQAACSNMHQGVKGMHTLRGVCLQMS